MVYRPTTRVLAVLELLQTHGHLTGHELATKLEVDVRTVRRYVTTLQDIGIPVEAEIGRHGGYAIHPGFKLPPLMFTDDEVLILTLGLLLARQSGLTGASAATESALAKVERVLPLALRERLRALVETMQLDTAIVDPLHKPPVEGEVLANLSLANRQGKQVRMSYCTRETPTERVFDPYTVIYHQAHWYTVGYCHLRQSRRVFRLDRVQDVRLLDTKFVLPSNFDALDYMLSSFEAIPDLWNVDVLLDMPLEAARQHIPRDYATLIQMEQGTRLRASLHDLNNVARVLIGLGCPLKAIYPPELRESLRDIAVQIYRYAEEKREQ